MADGIHRFLQSKHWKEIVFPAFKRMYPIDANKIELEMKGERRPLPASEFARGIVEEIRKHPFQTSPSTSWGLWEKPTVLLHNARGGVEYQSDQVKYFGSACVDLNSPNPWDNYIAQARNVNLPTPLWQHCRDYSMVRSLLTKIKATPEGTGGLNLEDMVNDGMGIPAVAALIDEVLGKNVILYIPTLGWMQNLDWSALSRHVFGLEFFLNDPPPEWVDIPDVELCKQLAEHAYNVGVKKVNFLCGVYDAHSRNPYARTIAADQYLSILRSAGQKFGGIYLGDTNGSDYARWADVYQ